jgi:hypothetical protein
MSTIKIQKFEFDEFQYLKDIIDSLENNNIKAVLSASILKFSNYIEQLHDKEHPEFILNQLDSTKRLINLFIKQNISNLNFIEIVKDLKNIDDILFSRYSHLIVELIKIHEDPTLIDII